MPEPTTLRTERLILRPFTFSDVENVLAYASDSKFSRFLPLPNPYTKTDAEEFVARNVLRNRNEAPSFAIEHQGTVVGAVDLNIETPISVASLHYGLSPTHWNQGLMTEATQSVLNWGFNEFELEKIYSWADVENIGSWRVMEKIGMKREGTLRSQGVNRGVRQDYHYYGILRSEWECSEPVL